MSGADTATFPTDVDGLPDCAPTEVVRLADGDSYELRITPVAKTLGDRRVRMLGYNGQIPGPTLRVAQGSEVTVRVRNEVDYETTVHWHGLRLENRFDGVPHDTQAPIPIGGEFTYRLRFPDDGIYWYHPHVREDYGLEMGLYGNILVDPTDPWPPVNREVIATLDDVFIDGGRIGTFLVDHPTHTAMGRFGNEMLTSGSSDLHLDARPGDIVRFYLTNTANTRIMNVTIPGVRAKLIGGDSGRFEHEFVVPEVMLAPSERAVVDVAFDCPGDYALVHNTPDRSYRLGTITIAGEPASPSFIGQFETLHDNDELAAERARLDADGDWDREPDKTLLLDAKMPLLYGDAPATASTWTCPMHPDVMSSAPGSCPQCGMRLVAVEAATAWTCPMHPDVMSSEPGSCPQCGMRLVVAEAATTWTCPMHPDVMSSEPGSCPTCGMKLIPSAAAHDADTSGHSGGHAMGHDAGHADTPDGLEWEDLMPDINAQTDDANMLWKLIDADTGAENHAIDWAFRVGDRIKIRLRNKPDSDHPMHHPFHLHGAGRFLILTRDGTHETNLVWKDTVLVRSGETVDILFDVSNPGLWMAHCHIAEHNQNGMMFSFRVND